MSGFFTMTSTRPADTLNRSVTATTRLVSLDVFRGLTMAAMVVVNNPGDWNHVYPPLLHATWDGWTPTDLIFPFFIFIVGVSITFSRRSLGWNSIARRGALILAFGLFLNGYPRFDIDSWRIPGVLQRIAICYVAAAGLYKLTAGHRRQGILLGAAGAATIVVYYLVMMMVAPPGGTRGDLSPEGNLGAYIDRVLFGRHMWKPRWDPEGLLSTLPALGTALFGVCAGLWLRSPATPERRVIGLAAAGVAGIGLGYAWDPWFPINKSLWTSSFVLFTAGAAALFLAACFWLVDVRGLRRGATPFVILGTNALALYVASGLLADTLGLGRVNGTSPGRFAYESWFLPLASPRNASLLYALAHLAVLFALLAWMYRRRIFLRV
jgi:predicted acyltransferase